ncbi:MAG: ATP-binding cassette domain-containing protein [Bacteroidetes bacterium]|nr:ATP-binding cassette domain-containing protein [Bacteroidota bacterium]
MSKQFLRFDKVTFTYENSAYNLFENISFQISNGWTGVTGVNGAGKSTLLKLGSGILKDFSGMIEKPINIFYNEQRTDNPPYNFSEFLNYPDKYAFKLFDKLKIEYEWINRWSTLSHGERKRAQIACAIWSKPDLLALDEPTNHLDFKAKEMIVEALNLFDGIGLIVSHDRELMENLCAQILFIEPPDVQLRQGKLSETINQRNLENDAALKQYQLKKIEITKLEKEHKRRSIITDKSKKKSSKRLISKHDHDAKAKIDLGRLTGKDAVGGRQKKLMQARIEKSFIEINNINLKRNYETGITLSDSVSKRNYLLNLKSRSPLLSEGRIIVHKDLVINPTDKISLTGLNGSGKSNLLKILLPHINADRNNISYIPQEISIEETKNIIEEIKYLSNEELGRLMIIISRLASDAKRILSTELPSPGETRKLLLGLGITKNPHIIIMDEPTNHMDMVSIECLEYALKNVNCALLLVSHDKRFLSSLTSIEWKIRKMNSQFILT